MMLTFKESETHCFEVTSHLPDCTGYVRVKWDGERIPIHRKIWEECFGRIPPGLFVCHRCDNRKCINPEHLFLGTHLDNVKDRDSKQRQIHGETHPKAKLTSEEVLEIRTRYEPLHQINSGSALAREFGVCKQTISWIVNGGTWKCLKE